MVTFERPLPDLGTEGDVIGKRIAAVLIDTIGIWIVFGILANVVASISSTLGVIVGLLETVFFFAYFIYFEAEYGQTIGKMAMDIVVVTEDGNPFTYKGSAIRNVLRIIDWLPVFYIVGFVAIYLTDRKQRLGDLIADTTVVRTKEPAEKL